jgi:aldose 1-epimerase
VEARQSSSTGPLMPEQAETCASADYGAVNKGGAHQERRFTVLIWAGATMHTEVSVTVWGCTPNGQEVSLYTVKTAGLEVQLAAHGARIVSIKAPDRLGEMADVVLGYDRLEDYLEGSQTRVGGVIGRYANRIGFGQFSIDGQKYRIPENQGRNAIHGGPLGFDRCVWQARALANGVEFAHTSPDGDMGFPGTLSVKVSYAVTNDSLRIDYFAVTDRATVLNLTNHVYFNLRGNDVGDILDEVLKLNASFFTPTDTEQLPTGEIQSVIGTPFDFRQPTKIGAHIGEPDEQLRIGSGYDQNFVIDGSDGDLREAAVVIDMTSGRTMRVETTEPGVQFYSGNHLDGVLARRHGIKYEKHAGFCLETQHFPDSPNHPTFPSTVLRPGMTFHSTTIFVFGTR